MPSSPSVTIYDTPTVAVGASGGTTVAGDVSPLAVAISDRSLQLSGVVLLSVFGYPAEFVSVSSIVSIPVVQKPVGVDVSGVTAVAVYRGKVEYHTLQSWTFSLDGHDFYVLRVGEQECLLYDLSTQTWSTWRSPGNLIWRARDGISWRGMTTVLRDEFHSNIVAGDDVGGTLWIMDPEANMDDTPFPELPPAPFPREVMTQSVMRGRAAAACYEVYVSASMGAPAFTGAGVSLLTSDDGGASFSSHGAIAVQPDNYKQELSWRSLGLITAPGRLFWIKDDGAVKRIDSVEMEDGSGD